MGLHLPSVLTWLAPALLGGFFSVAHADTLETRHATIEHAGEHSTLALIVGNTIDQEYGPMFIFFSQIGSMAPSPQKVPVNMDSMLLELQQMWPGQNPMASTNRDGDFTIDIDPDAVVGLDRLRTTVVHELFHHLSYRARVVRSDDHATHSNLWVLEGTAEIAEYYFSTPNQHKKNRFIEYLQWSANHQKSVINAKHHAALFIYYLWQQDPASFQELMRQFGDSHSGISVASSMAIDQHWFEFTKAMFNRAPITPILIDGSPMVVPAGDLVSPSFVSEGKIYLVPKQGLVNTEINLPPLSWQHAMLDVDAGVEWFNVHFDQLGDDDSFIVHAYLKDSQTNQYRYEDWSGKAQRRVCNQAIGPCEGQNLDKVSKVILIRANQSLDEELSGELVAGSLDQRWRLLEMQVNNDLIVPALGKLTLEFGTNGGMLVKSKGWWLKFPTDHFPTDTWQSAYNYINRACRFRGYVKFRRDIENEEISYEDDKQREKYLWPTTRIDKGGLTNTPSGWFCDFRREMAGLGGVPVTGLASQAVVARIFTDLNTTEYPANSFAGKLSAIMKAMMSLQVPQSGSKKVVMYHLLAPGEERRLQVELQGNVRAFFVPYPE